MHSVDYALCVCARADYVFNLRDLSRIWQGMLNCNADVVKSPAVLVSCWKHECTRVFPDRFFDQSDKDWFEKAVRQVRMRSRAVRVAIRVAAHSDRFASIHSYADAGGGLRRGHRAARRRRALLRRLHARCP